MLKNLVKRDQELKQYIDLIMQGAQKLHVKEGIGGNTLVFILTQCASTIQKYQSPKVVFPESLTL